jgi:hypothetical protein
VQRVGRGLFEVITATHETSLARVHFRNRLNSILWVTIGVDIIATTVVYFTEYHAAGTQLSGLEDAFIFTTSQLLTGGAAVTAVTTFGRVLTLFFDLYALTAVAALAGSFGQFFHHLHQERQHAADAASAAAAQTPGNAPPAVPPR